jgi:hypothetical protein
MRIVSTKKPKSGPAAPAVAEAVTERERPAQPATITGPRIVTAKKPRPRHAVGPEQIVAARDAATTDPPPVERKSAIVTSPRKTSTRFGPVQDLDAEEHRRRGDAAEALFREIVRRATGDGGR